MLLGSSAEASISVPPQRCTTRQCNRNFVKPSWSKKLTRLSIGLCIFPCLELLLILRFLRPAAGLYLNPYFKGAEAHIRLLQDLAAHLGCFVLTSRLHILNSRFLSSLSLLRAYLPHSESPGTQSPLPFVRSRCEARLILRDLRFSECYSTRQLGCVNGVC